MFLNGRFLAIAAPPDGNVEYQWFPHCVVRTQTADHLRFTTRLFLPTKRRAVAQSITIKNLDSAPRHFTLGFDMRGAVARKTSPWFANSPGEADNKITWDAPEAVCSLRHNIQRSLLPRDFTLLPNRVEHTRMLVFDMVLGPQANKRQLNFIFAIAENGRAAFELYDGLQAGFARPCERKTNQLSPASCKLRLLRVIPNSAEVCRGWLRNDESLWKLYHNGFANLLFARRLSPDSVYGPTYLTLSGHVLPTLSFPWDTSLTSLALALLDPIPLRKLVEVWLSGRNA